ncbi:hypothetical protein LJR234_005062 [Mesorhizobium amorphae]|uniref:hypothetical protein n=1 Tax=Mesorhizobium amorphae TaxID=71433 RepID=UPI003ECC4FC7
MGKRFVARCALCGELRLSTREHVIPRSFYPPSKATSRVQRIVIPTCGPCNNGTADDDVHLRNVISIAGTANAAVVELWDGPIRRSLGLGDGPRRAADMMRIMTPATERPGMFRIYPGKDERILRSVRKIIRGLSFHHELRWPLDDDQVFCDVLRAPVPTAILSQMIQADAEPDIIDYRYATVTDSPGIRSGWLLRFYERTVFIGMVFESAQERRRQEAIGELSRFETHLQMVIDGDGGIPSVRG